VNGTDGNAPTDFPSVESEIVVASQPGQSYTPARLKLTRPKTNPTLSYPDIELILEESPCSR